MKLGGDKADHSQPHRSTDKEGEATGEGGGQPGNAGNTQRGQDGIEKTGGDNKDASMDRRSPKDTGENVIGFDSLNTAEKDALVKRLRRAILKDEETSESCCISFLDWILEQFGLNGSAPPSAVLFGNLGYLRQKCDVEGIFTKEGNPELLRLYYESLCNSVEPDYKHEELDVLSLAQATAKYIKEKVEFLDSSLYQRVATAYRADEEKDYILKRLPFVLTNRSVFVEIVDMLRVIEQHKENNKVGRQRATEVFSACVFSWGQESTADPMDAQLRKEVFDDLLAAEFVYVPAELYQ